MGRGLSKQNFVTGKNKELRAVNSSIAIEIQEDYDSSVKFMAFDRRTKYIIGYYEIPLHTLKYILDYSPIKPRRKHA